MLKLTYTESGLRMERLDQSVEAFIAQRVLLGLRTGTSVTAQPSTASFLLVTRLPEMVELSAIATRCEHRRLSLSVGDATFTEVCLAGCWLTNSGNLTDSRTVSRQPVEGLLVAELSPMLERLLIRLWQSSNQLLQRQSVNFHQAS